ncbi:MAG TPA: IS200/IS605 family transposase [Bacteroidales bacterium]|nr:IS200/IS605 family transposase [Bacteroidales bacterium]HPS74704.1 IS200/IS605 family transposase [Bacteroidales bacterium]
MANTYTKCYIHLLFSPKNREALIKKEWKNILEKYITVVVQNRRHKLLAINAQPDHIHLLIGYHPSDLIPDLVEDIKTSSTHWVKENRLSTFKFEWQKGYGAFTHSKSQIDTVVKYIVNQDNHHKKRTFREEYLEILRKNEVEFDENYVFDFFN